MSFSVILCLLSRSSLHLYDRYILGIKSLNFFTQLFINNFLALFIALFIYQFFYSITNIFYYALNLHCFYLSILLFIVSLSFSYAFKYSPIHHVLIQSKISDLLASFFYILFIIFFKNDMLFQDKRAIVFFLNILACIPLIFSRNYFKNFYQKAGLFLILCLILQTYISPILKNNLANVDSLTITLSMLAWRCFFATIIFCIKIFIMKKKQEYVFEPFLKSYKFLSLCIFRSIIMLGSYLTFILALKTTNPLLTFSILNSAPILSTILSNIILREKICLSYIFVIILFTFSSIYYIIF